MNDAIPFSWKPTCSIDKTIIVNNANRQFIAYNPCNRQVAYFEMDEFDISSAKNALSNKGFATGGNIPPRSLSLTFSVSDKCGMDCIYCFSGDKASQSGAVANFENVVDAIDSFFLNDELSENPTVAFFGAGEPFMNFNFIKDTVLYTEKVAQKYGISPRFMATSNCTFNEEILRFIIKHNIYLSASVDGPPNVQNKQRPLKGGTASSDIVMHNVRQLIEAEHDFHVRSTITKESSHLMADMTEFWANLGINKIYFEPVSIAGKCKNDITIQPSPEEFGKNFISSIRCAQNRNISVNTEAVRKLRTGADFYFCPAVAGDNLLFTTDGRRAFCYEDLSSNNVGPFIATHETNQYFTGQLKNPVDFTNWPVPSCKKCPIFLGCGGTCPRRALKSNNNLLAPYAWQCKLNRMIIPEVISLIWEETINNKKGEENEN